MEEAVGRRRARPSKKKPPVVQRHDRIPAAGGEDTKASSQPVGEDPSEAERLIALLAEPDRLRVVSALALGASTVRDIKSMTGLDARAVEKALSRLINGDLVVRERDGSTRLVTEELLMVARRSAVRRQLADELEGSAPEGPVLRRFVRGGRLISIPATRSKRLIVLDHIAQTFEPGRRYPERSVNEMLVRYDDDVASLRRYLVDEGLMERAEGHYWRSGGTFDV